MKAKVSVLFYTKKSKAKVSSKIPVYMRITVNGHRAELSTGKTVELSRWNAAQSRVKGNSDEARAVNRHFDVLLSKVLEIENKLVFSGEAFDAADIKNLLTGAKVTERYLVPVFEEHNSRMEQLVGKEYALATLKNFKTCLAHLKSFLWKFHKKSDINLVKIEQSFLNDFDFYLRSQPNIGNNATVKHTKNLSKILKLCYRNNWIEKDLAQFYSGKFTEVSVNFLTEEELQIIQNKEFIEAGKKRLSGDTAREATSDEVAQLREENRKLKETVADLVIRYDIIKKSLEILE